jgi:hypothetical protein
MRVHFAEAFMESLARLDGRSAAAVKRAAFDVLASPSHPGLHLHRLVHAVDRGFWSLRVSRELRVIVHRSGADLVLCHAGHHDEAYAWAAQRVWSGAACLPADGEALVLDAARPTRTAGPGPDTAPAPRGRDPAAAPDPAPTPAPAGLTSARRERARVRALAALPPSAPRGASPRVAPPPFKEVLRFLRDRQGAPSSRPPPPAEAPPRARARGRRLVQAALVAAALLAVPAALVVGGGRPRAASVAFGMLAQALVLLLVGLSERRRLEQSISEARAEAADGGARAEALGDALVALSLGERPPSLDALGERLQAPRAAVELLAAFLDLSPAAIRALADGARPPAHLESRR